MKLCFSNMYFCWLLFRAKLDCNFIQSHVSCVGIYCKGCVIVRESVKIQAIKARMVFTGISRLEMRRVSIDGDSYVS